MLPEDKAKFWTEVYIAAVRSVAANGHVAAIPKASPMNVTEYAAAVADRALEELNRRLNAQSFIG